MTTWLNASFEMRFRLIGGLTVRFAASPDGQDPALLLSPWPESLLAFEPVWSRLAEQAHLVAVDLPGFGHSQRSDSLLSPRAMGEFIIAAADAFGLDHPHVVAPGTGTTAALFAAAAHPGLLRSLVAGGGGAVVPLQLGGLARDIVEAPGLDGFRRADPRQLMTAALSGIAAYRCPSPSGTTTWPPTRETGSPSRSVTCVPIRLSFPSWPGCCRRLTFRCSSSRAPAIPRSRRSTQGSCTSGYRTASSTSSTQATSRGKTPQPNTPPWSPAGGAPSTDQGNEHHAWLSPRPCDESAPDRAGCANPHAARDGRSGPGSGLQGRRGERELLDRLIADVRACQSRILVLHGEPGTGKTALLDYLAQRAGVCRVARVTGAEPEMELAFAGLHQLCAPFVDRIGHLPDPQRDALRTAFGLQGGDVPDRFAVGLATLSLLSELARERPLVCVVDDAQWLDQASAQALAFVARHLAAAPAAVIFAVRHPADQPGLAGLPEFQLGALADSDARALLDSVLIGPLDERVREQIVAEARGNPRALLELPRGLTPGDLAGGFGLPAGPGYPAGSKRITGSSSPCSRPRRSCCC